MKKKLFIVSAAIFALSAYCLAEEPAPCEVLNPHKPYLENFESYGPTVTSALATTKGYEISPSWWKNAKTPTCWTVGNEKLGTDTSVCTSSNRSFFPYIFSNGAVTINTTTGFVDKTKYYDKSLNSSKYAPEGYNALKMATSTVYGIVWAAMPELTVEDISSLVISASARFTKATATIPHALIVGIMEDPTDLSTFVVLDSIVTGAGTTVSNPAQKIEVSVIEKGYSGKGRYVAFRTAYNPNASATAKYKVCGTTVFLDSVALRVEPFYAQNNWETERDWSWKQMVRMSDSICRMDSVVFGGLGINFNDTTDTPDATWVDASDFKGDAVQAKDTVSFTYNTSTKEVTMTLIGRPTYKITTSVNLSSRGYTTGDTAVFYGDTVIISAEAYYGYNFTRWDDYNTDNPRKVKVTNDINYQATFSKNKYQLTVSANGPGSVTGGGSYSYNSKNTITATPDPNCQFIQWNDGNTDNPRDITLTQDTAFVASFSAPATAQIVVTYDLQGHGEAIENDTINSGEQITEPAKPTAEGFEFVGWFKEAACETLFDFNQTITATQDSTMTLYAYWAKKAEKNGFKSGEQSGFTLDANISATISGSEVVVNNEKLVFAQTKGGDRSITVNATNGCTIVGFIVEYEGFSSKIKLGNDNVTSGKTNPLNNVQSFTLNISITINSPQRMARNAAMAKAYLSISSIKVLYNAAPAPVVETYGRKLSAKGNYGTICLPKAFSAMEGVDALYVPHWQNTTTDVLNCVEVLVSEVEAGKAYIFKAKADKDTITFTLTGDAVPAPVVEEGDYMIGWLAADSVLSQDFIDAHSDHFMLVDNVIQKPIVGSTLLKNRALIDLGNVPTTEQPAAPGRRTATFGKNTPTGVVDVNANVNANRKMMINGQLVIIRDGRKFNAQGQEL